MLKVASINLSNVGSTGKIVSGISSTISDGAILFYNCYPYDNINSPKKENDILICNKLERKICRKLSTIFGVDGLFGTFHTRRFLQRLKKFRPDIIHFHNLHFGYLDIPLIIKYIKENDIRVIWTLHDCWSFTGRCPHFTVQNCYKWKAGCNRCPYPKIVYPFAKMDRTKKMWKLKKKWFTGIKNLTIVTPSNWLANLVKQSYLKDYHVRVINNGIDLSIFKPSTSNFKERNNIPHDRFVVLGVAFGWSLRKGLDVFIKLSHELDEKYQIVLVGTNDEIDTQLPSNITSIHRTNNQQELAKVYTAADLFVNPTREENYPTVNMESLACGTPVLTFRTGGSPEIIDETCGSVVDVDDIDSLEKEIIRICETKPYSKEACLERAKLFDINDRFKEYIDLYKELSGNQ